MDFQADFEHMFEDGDDVVIDGVTIKGFIARPGVVSEPFYGDERDGDGFFVIVQKSDLEDLAQWPLDDPVVVVEAITYRVIRPHENGGHVQLFLQEA